jgi:GNAT superfamily N-acetyltransferase
MKKLSDEICEIKRMYVRPNFRKQGVGRAMLQHLIDEARAMGYGQMYLDSANFMQAAHALYRSMGFRTIEPYDGSEIPQDFQKHWQFMALVL